MWRRAGGGLDSDEVARRLFMRLEPLILGEFPERLGALAGPAVAAAVFSGVEARSRELRLSERAVYDHVARHAPQVPATIRRGTKLSRVTVWRAIRALGERGLVEVDAEGFIWVVPIDAGASG